MEPSKVRVRPYRDEDHAQVVRIWQAGFLELHHFLHREVISSPRVVTTLLGAAGTAAFFRRFYLAGALAVLTASLLSPLGKQLASGMMWLGILAETRRDMSPAALRDRWQKDGESAFYVAECEGVVVGCVGIKGTHTLIKERRYAPAVEPREASVWRLSVDRDARRLGVARQLMAEVEGWAAAHGYRNISLICGNPESKRFYASIGYTRLSMDDVVAAVWGPGATPASVAAAGSLADRWKLSRFRVRSLQQGNFLAKPVAADGRGRK